MMLARQDLVNAWKAKKLRFDPDISIDQINLSSVDLRLGTTFTRLKAQPAVVIRPAQDFDPSTLVENFTLATGQPLRLKPKEFLLGQTLEKIFLPPTCAAQIHGRSSLARAGLSVHATAPHIHPGFEGPITLELCNSAEWELEFFSGDVICQIILWEVKTPPHQKVIAALSTYRGQKVPYPERRKG